MAEIRCDRCHDTAEMRWTGTMWLLPVDWYQLPDFGDKTSLEICASCKKALIGWLLGTDYLG